MKSNILITGGSSGIGLEYLMRGNAIIFPLMRNKSTKNISEQIFYYSSAHGKFDGFVHFAGIQYTEPINLFTKEKFDELMWSNVGLAMEIIKHVTKQKYRSDNFSIVLISSVAALRGDAGIAMYAASKAALIGLTKSLAAELALKGIRVNCISPGHVNDTRMSNNARKMIGEENTKKLENKHLLGFVDKDDVCNMVEYLLSDKAKKITGQNFVIDGGYTV